MHSISPLGSGYTSSPQSHKPGLCTKRPSAHRWRELFLAQRRKTQRKPPKTRQRFASLRLCARKCPRQKTLFVQSRKPESLRLHRACLPTFDDLRSSFIFLDFLEVFGCVPSNKTFTERRNVPFDAALLNAVRDVFDTTSRE